MSIKFGWGEIEKRVDDKKAELQFLKNVKRNQKTLKRLEDILSFNSDIMGTFYMTYTGKAKTEDDARSDLARIQRELKCLFSDLHVPYSTDSRPQAYYEGDATIGDWQVKVHIDVPWLPNGCQVHVERRRTWSNRSSYSVYCRR